MPSERPTGDLFSGYMPLAGTFDELLDQNGRPREGFAKILAAIGSTTPEGFGHYHALAELALLNQGVTFSVYADSRGAEKIFPFDLVPRMVAAQDWKHLDRGLQQRVRALGMFLDDVYGPQRILEEKIIPRELVLGSKGYLPVVREMKPPGGVR
ncbi:MAG: circularly permuted type 2 ATP-grasp protein, partial [Polyangiales bacterium]